MQKQVVEHTGNGEHDMEVWNRQEVLFALFDPCFALCVLAFRAMPVTARVVTDTHMPACVAFIHMSAQRRSTAAFYGTKRSLQVCVGGMFLFILGSEPADDLHQFEWWLQPFLYNLSNGLNRFVLLGLAT